jgi:tyrosyl-tRNA synthetase
LKYFTFLTRDEIDELERLTKSEPEKREAQRVLADRVSRLVHGDEDTARVERANTALFSATLNVGVDEAVQVADRLTAIAGDVPSTTMAASDFEGQGITVVDVVVRVKFATSKSEARRLVQQGGVKVNDQKMMDPSARLTLASSIDGRIFLLQKGSRQRHLVLLT